VPSQEKRQRQKANTAAAREARAAAEKRKRMLRTGRNVGIVVVLFAVLVFAVSFFNRGSNKKASPTASSTVAPTTTTPAIKPVTKNVKLTGFVADPNKKFTATIDTNFGPIVVALDSKTAPKASGRFIELARAGFYDGLSWHRVVKDFVIQAGDPKGDGSGGSGNPPIVDTVPTNHYPVGSVAAAKTGTDPKGTFDSQFFIVTGSQGGTLPNDYALFGKVTSGIDNAKKIEALAPASGDGPPTGKATINKITIAES
jgi:cyclophilin family peptidyl-prolyl cis-trans isomerase